MSERKLFILGTAALVPTRERHHHACFLRWDNEGFLFDPGEGTQQQLIYAGISASRITRIFISHFHGDHCLGLAGIAQRISLDRVPHPVLIYYPASGQEYLDRLLNASSYYNQARFVPIPVTDSDVVSVDADLTIEARALDHVIDCYGYSITEKDTYTLDPAKLDRLGIRGADIATLKNEGRFTVHGRQVDVSEAGTLKPGQKVAFVMDTRFCQSARELARGADLLICESTFLSSEADHAEKYGHLTAAQAARIAGEAEVGQLVLTHFSGRHPDAGVFHQEAAAIFPRVFVARDGACLPVRTEKRIIAD